MVARVGIAEVDVHADRFDEVVGAVRALGHCMRRGRRREAGEGHPTGQQDSPRIRDPGHSSRIGYPKPPALEHASSLQTYVQALGPGVAARGECSERRRRFTRRWPGEEICLPTSPTTVITVLDRSTGLDTATRNGALPRPPTRRHPRSRWGAEQTPRADYVRNLDEFEWLPGAKDALRSSRMLATG